MWYVVVGLKVWELFLIADQNCIFLLFVFNENTYYDDVVAEWCCTQDG